MTRWQEHAACRGKTHLYYGPAGEDAVSKQRREERAHAVCMVCPVLAECLADAADDEYGYRAGLTPEERARPRRPQIGGRRPVYGCGTVPGYKQHRRRNETPCDPCRLAHNAYYNAAKARMRARRRAAVDVTHMAVDNSTTVHISQHRMVG